MATYDMNDVKPDLVVENITEEQCESLKLNTGADPEQGKTNCEFFNDELIPLLQQEVNSILHGSDINIYANNESKCADDGLPTHASMWSRILRYSQALTCILCAYDPFLAQLLKSGRYPQVLMAAEGSEYPVWQTPDSTPRKGSQVPVTSGGVYQAIQDAILSVWHIWEDYPEIQYLVQNTTELNALTGMADGDIVLVATGPDGINEIMSWNDAAGMWVEEETFGVDLANFTVTHVEKGYWANKELYYMNADGTPVWSLMDATIAALEDRMDDIEDDLKLAVKPYDGTTEYLLTTRATLAAANAVPAVSGKTSIILITG